MILPQGKKEIHQQKVKIHDDFIVKNDPLYAQNNGETLPRVMMTSDQ